jgi:hypothetical protein
MITILHPGTPLGPGHRAAATPPGPPPARLPPPAHPRPRRLPTSSSSSWSLAAVIAASPTTAARPRPCAAAGMSGSPWAWPTQFHRLTLAAYDRLHCLDLEHLAVDGCITKALRWPGRRAPHGDAAAWAGPGWARVACPVLGQARTSSLWGRVGRAGTLGLVADRPATLAVGMDAPALDGWTLLGYPAGPHKGGHLADGHRRSRPYGGLSRSSFRTPRPTRTDGRLQTTRGTRPAMRSAAAAVRLGVRSCRPAGQAKVSILDGCPGGCPSGCPAVGLGASIPTACRGWKGQENRMSGRWRSARRRLAPTTRPWPAIRGNVDVVVQASRTHLQRSTSEPSRDIPTLWRTTASCSSTSCRSSPGPRARRSVNRSRRARSRSPGP